MHQCITVHHGASRCITGCITGCIMVHHSASWSAKTHQAGGYTATPLGRWYWHVSCVLCSFSTTAASYEPTLGVWAGVSPWDTKKIARCGFVSKTYQKPYLLADFMPMPMQCLCGAHRASWCIMVHHGASHGASYTNGALVHQNASPVHHTVHHRVHQKGALRCIKGGRLLLYA